MKITDWPADQRPRERLIRHGAQHLSDSELLAIFLRTGIKGKSAVDLAHHMLNRYGSLAALFAADIKDFSELEGVGPAKYAQIQAVVELSRRLLAEEMKSGVTLTTPKAVTQYLQLMLGDREHESFVALFLDVKNRLIDVVELFRGSLTQTRVYPREVVKAALSRNAAGVILAHNHPSGSVEPSAADRSLTQALKSALALIDVRVLDHFVVAGTETYSFAENGLL